MLWIYDRPLRRDSTFWATAVFACLAAASIGTSDEPTSIPRWLNTLLAVIAFAIIFGAVPAVFGYS